jgi:hypothetical protein
MEGQLRIVVNVSCRCASHDHFPEAQDVCLGAFGGEGVKLSRSRCIGDAGCSMRGRDSNRQE